MTVRLPAPVLALAACLALSTGCGLRGDLERPPPLWGDPPNEGPLDPRNVQTTAPKKADPRSDEPADAKRPETTQSPAPSKSQ